MTADYLVFARDSSNTIIGQIDDYESLTLNPKFNDVGAWAMTLDANSAKAALFDPGTGIVVYRKPTGGSWAVFFSGPLGSYGLKGDASGDTLTLGGPDDMTVLADRLALPGHGYPYETLVSSYSPLAYYRLGESFGTTASDASGHARNGTYHSGVALGFSAGIDDPDTCASFDGTVNAYVSCPTVAITTGSWWMHGWFYLAAAGTLGATDFACIAGYDANHRLLVHTADGKVWSQIGSASANTNLQGTVAHDTNTWHHVAYVWDGTKQYIYVDGALDISGTTANTPIWNSAYDLGTYGAGVAGTNYAWNGGLDEFAIGTGTLTAANITQIYNTGISRFGAADHEEAGYGRAGTGIWFYIDLNAGTDASGIDGGDSARVNSELSIGAAPTTIGSFINASARFDNLLTLCQNMATQGGDIGFRVLQSGTGLSLSIYTPADKTSNAKFSRDLGNLLDYDYSLARPKANYVYTLGGGQGTSRRVLEVDDSTSLSDWGRVEGSVDARDTTDVNTMYGRGQAYLDQNKSQVNFSCTAIDTDTCTYGKDYDLGDKVKVFLPDGTVVSDIVREVKIELTRAGGEDVKVGVGNPGNGAVLTPANAALRSVLSSHIETRTRVAQLERRW